MYPLGRRSGLAFVGVVLCLILAAGCSEEQKASPKDEAAMRESYQKKGFNVNDIPPEQRERVKGFMKPNNSGSPPATSSTKPAQP